MHVEVQGYMALEGTALTAPRLTKDIHRWTYDYVLLNAEGHTTAQSYSNFIYVDALTIKDPCGNRAVFICPHRQRNKDNRLLHNVDAHIYIANI